MPNPLTPIKATKLAEKTDAHKTSHSKSKKSFLSDSSPIIGYACHSPLTHSLTDSCLVNLIDVTLACEDANSKMVEIVTVADVDAKKHVDNSLVQIW